MKIPSRTSIHMMVLFAACTSLAASLGGYWTDLTLKTWYPTLVKPAGTPPAYVFGPVWTLLYAMMTVAAWRVWNKAGWAGARSAFVLFFIQLALNAAWSGLFFALKNPRAGAVEIVVLWMAIAVTQRMFREKDRLAGALMIPYLIWIAYAAYLNVAIWKLNS